GGYSRRVDGIGQHVGAQPHARAAAGRGIIDAAVAVGGRVPDVPRLQCPQAGRQRLTGEAHAERTREHLRKQRQHRRAPDLCLGSHAQAPALEGSSPSISSGNSITTRPPFRSTDGTTALVNGSSIVAPLCGEISMISPAPKLWIAMTRPRGSFAGEPPATRTRGGGKYWFL